MVRSTQKQSEDVVARAMDAFWQSGYGALSVRELVHRTGLHRRSLYAMFGDKHGLYLSALDRYVDTVFAPRLAILNGPGSPRASILAFIRTMVFDTQESDTDRRGSLLLNAGLELAAVDPEVGTRVSQAIARAEEAVELAVIRAQREGEISKERNASALAHAIVAGLGGLLALARTGWPANNLRDTIDELARTLQ